MSSVKKTEKRRYRKKKILNPQTVDEIQSINIAAENQPAGKDLQINEHLSSGKSVYYGPDCSIVKTDTSTMANDSVESREKVKAAREAKKLAKQQAKLKKDPGVEIKQPPKDDNEGSSSNLPEIKQGADKSRRSVENVTKEHKSKDEVDRAVVNKDAVKQETIKAERPVIDKDSLTAAINQEIIKVERAARKAAKENRKRGGARGDTPAVPTGSATVKPVPEMTVRDVVQTLKDIKMVAEAVTAQAQALNVYKESYKYDQGSGELISSKDAQSSAKELTTPKAQLSNKDAKSNAKESEETSTTRESEEGKSKAQLRAERRAKQEAQRAAKEAAAQAKTVQAKPAVANSKQNIQPSKDDSTKTVDKEKSPKPKSSGKQSSKQSHRVNWFRHVYNDDKPKLDKLPVNSNLHPAIVKLGVQLSTRTVSGSNARCIALLHALKTMVRDFSLPARTEVARGLEAALGAALSYLWARRQPCASQTNAVKFFRHRLAQLPNNVDEFDAKKSLQEEIERYIREQIDMAGEAISITVRGKIRAGDVILTYGCSSLIERIFVEAWGAGVSFRAVVVGAGAAREMARRLSARRVPCVAADLRALGFIMPAVDKVVLGASALLGNGAVLGAAGTAAVALAARARNVPVLVACETHKFSDRVQTDAFVYNEIGDPDDLIDKSDKSSPLRDWRSNPNLTPLNLTYDVTPPQLVTAVVTELALLPCTSAPVVLRFKLSEYSV